MEDKKINLASVLSDPSQRDKEQDVIWALIQIAAHPHTQSLYSIVKQEHIQKTALTKFPILKPDVSLIVPEAEDDDKPALSQISVASLHSVFELLRQVSLSAPALLSSVISTTDQCIKDLPQKCFTGNDLAAGSWQDFLKDISVVSTDKTTFKVLLCVAILQNRADLILSAIRHTLKAKIADIETCGVISDLQRRSLNRYKSDRKLTTSAWNTSSLSNVLMKFSCGFVPDNETFSMASDGLHVYIFNSGELFKFSSGIGGSVLGKCIKRVALAAVKLKLVAANNVLLAVKTGKSRSVVSINKETLTIEKTHKLDVGTNTKCVADSGKLLLARGTWSSVTLQSVDLSVTPPTIQDLPDRALSVTSPAVLAFGSTGCDSEKMCHVVVKEDVKGISGTDSYTLTIGMDGKLKFSGNADEIGTGQGLIDKWVELPVGSVNRFTSIACPHQEKYVILLSEDGKPYIAGHIKRGVDGDSSKPKKKPAPSKPKLIDRIKDRVVACAAGNTTSAFVTECGQLYMFGLLAQPFESSGLVPQFSVLSVKSVTLGHNHAAILTTAGTVYTMGSNTQGQCGRNYIHNPDLNPEEEESDSDDGMCEPGTHVWRNILCMICFFCGECTGYGPGCCRNGEPDRDPGLECGCGAGDSGCSICGCCKTCAKEAQLVHKKNAKFKAKPEPKPLRFGNNPFESEDDSSNSDNSSVEEDEEDYTDEDEKGARAERSSGTGTEDSKPTHPAELTKLPAPIKLPDSRVMVKQVACGMHHTVLLLETGDVYGFGCNSSGQLGMGSLPVVSTPTKIQNIDAPADVIACGATHTVVLAGNQVFSCGKYMDGQLGRCPSDFSKDSGRSDSSLTSKSWYSNMCKVPGFGGDSDRIVTSVTAVGNRTFVTCRTPLIKKELHMDDEVEIILDDGKFVLCSVGENKKLSFLTPNESSLWNSKDTGLSRDHVLCFDEVYKTIWSANKRSGTLSAYTSYNSFFTSSHTNPLSMRESLLPHLTTEVNKEALCYGLLCHVTSLANQVAALDNKQGPHAPEELLSACNRFPSFGGGWGYSQKSVDAILMTTDTDILLYGLGLYGGRGNYTAKLKIYDIGYGGPEPDDGDLIFEMPSYNYTCKPKAIHTVCFDDAVSLVAGTWYRVTAKVEGPSSDCGNSGKREVVSDGVKFTFRSSKRSNNGTDSGSGQIPQFLFRRKVVDPKDASSNTADVMPLGNWETGLDHLLGIIKLSFTALNSYIMSKRSDAGKINKSALSLNLASSDVSLSNSSIASIASEHSFDPKQSNLESKLSVPISMLNNFLTVSPHQEETPEKQRLLKECQDLLSAILQLPVPSDSLLVRKVTKVYSKHFHLFYKSPQHIWASFLAAFQSYSDKGEKYGNILRTILQAMCYQGSAITNELFHYGTLTGMIMPRLSDMSLGSQDGGIEDNTSLDQSLFETLNNVNYRTVLGHVISLAVSDTIAGLSARNLLKTILQQIVLASMDLFNPLSVAVDKETPSRFSSVNISSWNSKAKPDAISFKVHNSSVFLSGIGVFQTAKDSSCDIEILVKDSQDRWKTVLSHSGQVKNSLAKGHFCRINFKKPLALKAEVQYTVKVQLYSQSVAQGKSTVPQSQVCGLDGVTFTFYDCVLSSSGTNVSVGQIPFLIYKTQLNPEVKECDGNESYENVTLQLIELISTAFIKAIEEKHLKVPVAWPEENGIPDPITPSPVPPEGEMLLPQFMATAMSYTELILINKGTPKASYLLLENVLKPLLSILSEHNFKKRTTEQESVETVIVESDHPYPEATVLHYQTVLSDSVSWMVAEFSPESGIGPDDSLEIYVSEESTKSSRKFLNLASKKGGYHPILTLGASKDWPKRALLLPGNQISFLLRSVTKINKQQLNDSDWGFSCKVSGYKFKKERRTLHHLEHILADLAGSCVRVMISPCNNSLQKLSQEGQYAFKAHAKLLSRGLYLNSLPDSYGALKKRSFLEEEPKKMRFLKDFMGGNKSTSGGRLALWLDPTESVEITKAFIEIGIFDGEEEHYVGTVYPVVCCIQSANNNIIFPLGAKVNVAISKLVIEDEQITPMTSDCFEEERYSISKNLRIPTLIDAKSYNNGFYSITWEPDQPGTYEMTVYIDGAAIGIPAKTRVIERTKPVVKTKKSEQLLEDFRKKRKQASDSQTNVTDQSSTVEYEIVKCGAAGHTLRGAMSCSSSPLGLLPAGTTLLISRTVQNSEGLWGMLSERSAELHCSTKCPAAYTLISTPFNVFLSPTSNSDPNQVFVLRTTSKEETFPPTVVFDHGSNSSHPHGNSTTAHPAKSEYSISFLSDTSDLVDDIEVKCVNSKSLTNTIRTVFAAYLWHYGAVDDAMAAAAYIKFENPSSNGDSDHQDLKRHKSTPSKLHDSKVNSLKSDYVRDPTAPCKKRTSSYTTQRTSEGEDTPENVSSLSMLCSLWDSVKDLIMTCATTKIKPPPPITDDSNKDSSNRPKKKRSKKCLKTVQSANNDETKEQCELCGQKVPHPVTYHMSKHHPGCKSNCGGMGYNGKGIYCSGWSGLCGDGGKGLCTWYLLCSECVETYKQEPLPNDDTNKDAVYAVEVPPNLPTVSTSDLEEQLSNTYKNALFLLFLAPIKEVSSPDSLDYVSFLEEAMDTDVESTKNKFRSLQLCDSVSSCLSPMTPMSPCMSSRFSGTPGVSLVGSKMHRSMSVNVLPSSRSDPNRSNILQNPSPQLKKLATVISLDRGWLFGFMSQKQPLQDLEEELIRGVEKAWLVSQGLQAADWLLKTVSSLPILHSVLWRLYMGLLPDPTSPEARQKGGLLPICQHPISSSIKCYDSCVSAAFRGVMQSLSDLLPRLPAGSHIQKVAISCWNLEFRPEDHKFLQDSQVFSHIHRLLTSASRRESPTPLPSFHRSVEIADVELTVSSRDSLIPYLHDKKTDTFWESGDKDNWISIKIPANKSVDALAVHLNNDEDRGFITTKVSLKVGNQPKVLKTHSSRDLSTRHNGWLWFEVSGYTHIELEFTAKNDHVRVRQLVVFGGVEEVSPTSTLPSCQQFALQVFRVLTNDILKNITKDVSKEEGEVTHTSADLQEHLVSILFEQSHLTETQNKVLMHVVSAIRKQTLSIADKNSFNDDYCFELLSLVSALSGSSEGCDNLVVHESLIQDVFKLLHMGTKRIQRQVILLLRRILSQISPEKLCAITNTCIPRFPYDEEPSPAKPSPDASSSAKEKPNTPKRTVLNKLLAYIMKSIVLIVKSKGRRSGEGSKMNLEHPDYWVRGTVAPDLALEVMNLLQDMSLGNLGEEWKECSRLCLGYIVFCLTHIPDESRTEDKIAQNRGLWLALSALSVMEDNLASSVTVTRDASVKVDYCENHDDGRTKAIISCNKCGYLCTECDKYLHLSRKSKAHQRQVFKAAEASVVISKHENMCRVKLYWMTAAVDTQSRRAVIEFKNTYSAQPDAFICRFCNEAGEPSPEGGTVCKNEECNAKMKVSCKQTLECGHPCSGNAGETKCLPCLKNCSGTLKQDADDMCVICFTESLGCAPCLQLTCGHILHSQCIATVVRNRWIGPRITFSFLHCPICKGLLEHEYLDEMLKDLHILMEDVKKKSVMRLKYDGLSFDSEEEAVENAMNKYAYYQCFKCKKAYFGGEAQCQADAGDDFDPEDLVCGGCSNLSQEVCPKHGTDYLEYKCRYCCSVAVYFCFGTTHFCTPCHDDFVRLRGLSKDALPQCPVGPKASQLEGSCPLGLVDHPATGEEFALGCGVCRNVQTF
ncbi:hypothetical protein ACHWQZ_G002322 [Mnemiopsis leidyi]